MIEYRKGNLFDHSGDNLPYDNLLHGCNCRGVMGAGFAVLVKEKFPKGYSEYNKICNAWQEEQASINHVYPKGLGELIISDSDYPGTLLINAITQDIYYPHGNKYVSYDAVDLCMVKLNTLMKERSLRSVTMPKIGAGLGGGDWNVIEAIINHRLSTKHIIVYEL